MLNSTRRVRRKLPRVQVSHKKYLVNKVRKSGVLTENPNVISSSTIKLKETDSHQEVG
jgi:hypothetical protein